MFKSAQHFRSFITLVITYIIDLVGFSIAFPILAPLLLNPELHFFSPGTPETIQTTVLGILLAAFGATQFLGVPIAGALADYYGRYKILLGTIGLSVVGYMVMAWGVYTHSLVELFIGRMVTGLCSGNVSLVLSATADLTESENRSKAFGALLGVGGLGFIAGPWIGGKLANPEWFSGAAAFLFAASASFLNFLVVLFFFVDTWKRSRGEGEVSLFTTFKELRLVFKQREVRALILSSFLFACGWAFFNTFCPTFLVQKFELGPDQIGNIFAYMALIWFIVSMFLNKYLVEVVSAGTLIVCGSLITAIGVILFLVPNSLSYYWIIIPIVMGGSSLAWININALLSTKSSADMQGRVMGASGSVWSLSQVVASTVAGPLAGANMYLPLATGAVLILLFFLYFGFTERD